MVARQGFLGDNITSLHDKGRLSLACYTILRLPVYYITMFVVATLLMALSIIEDPNAIIPEDRKPAIRLVSYLAKAQRTKEKKERKEEREYVLHLMCLNQCSPCVVHLT